MDKTIPHSRPTIRKEELKTTLECMIFDYIAPGKLVEDFEKKLKAYLGVSALKAVSSGTAAFYLILKLLDIQEGDEIIVPSYAPAILLQPIQALKAVPVPVDIHSVDYSPLLEEIRIQNHQPDPGHSGGSSFCDSCFCRSP